MSEAARRCGVKYCVVYRFVHADLVRSARDLDNGVIFVDERDLDKIEKHVPPPTRKRIAVQLVPSVPRHAAWEAAARERDKSVTELAYQLLDRASKWTAS